MPAFLNRIRVVVLSVEWIAIAAAALLATHARDPLLLFLRPHALLLISGIAVALSAVHVVDCLHRRTRPYPIRSWAILVVLALVALVAALGEERFQAKRRAVREARPAALQRVGGHLVVGYESVREIAPLVERGAVGGIFVTRRNAAGKSMEELQMEIRWLQGLYAAGGKRGPLTLLVATDQEGGIVSHLSPPLTPLPPLAEWISSCPELSEAVELAKAYGEIHGRELAGLGVNLNLSPVVDLKMETVVEFLDFYSQIPRRAIAPEPERVAAVALAYAKGLESEGVLATGKHFPGLGPVKEDTHLFSARLSAKTSDLEKRDWLPFRALANHSNSLLMLAHVKLAEVDDEMPSSLSRAVVQGLLRRKWSFQGLLITDDLSMRTICCSDLGIGEAAVKALNAGVDLLLVAYDGERAYDVLYELLEADREGRLDPDMLEASRERFTAVSARIHSIRRPFSMSKR